MNDRQDARQAAQHSWTVQVVLGWAFVIWLAMLLLPLLMFTLILIRWNPQLSAEMTAGRTGRLFVVMAVCAVLVSGVSFLHRHLFRAYWRDGVVQPRGYLLASVILWTGIAASSIVALVAAAMDGSLIPNLIIAAMMFMTLTATWPKGRAMVHRRPREEEDSDEEVLHLPEAEEPSSTDGAPDQR
ncbi:MAG: hypothetical protein ACODAQ_01160 [Phycisphaeraceae bacterium]